MDDDHEDKSNLGGTIVAGDQTKMTMTIGLDGLMESPVKSMFKGKNN
jgi:hypothetical protein